MAYVPHNPVKAEKLVETAAPMVEQQLTLPNLFQKESFDAYKGARGDKVNIKVEGVLPFHTYAFRNDRSQPLQTDTYAERTISVGVADHVYSNVHLTDEQVEFDLLDAAKLIKPQTKAVARGLQRRAAAHIAGADYQVTIGGVEQNPLGGLLEARRVLNKFQQDEGGRFLVVGSDFETMLQEDEKVTFAQYAGDSQADSALHDAIIGRIKGFTVVLDNTIAADEAYAFVSGSAFVWANAAPAVPNSVGFGSTTSFEGVGLRVMRDYDYNYQRDRQVVDTWTGMRSVTDILVGWNEATNSEIVGEEEHFIRGVKLTVDGSSAYPEIGSELATITGVSAGDAWEAGLRGDITPEG